MISNLLSRKFIISLICLLMVFVGFLLNKISSDIFMPFVLGILGLYTAGNVGSKIAE